MDSIKLGQAVTYFSSKGDQKLAFVLGTRKSIKKGTDIVRPDKGCVNLEVHAPNGKVYVRENVCQVESADGATNAFQVI